MNKYLLLTFLFITLFITFSQENNQSLSNGFRNIQLGLNIDEAKEAIESDGYFDYRGDPDVSMLLSEEKSIIESRGNYYIKNGYFQFYKDTLYTITLILDTNDIDYYTMFTTLSDKYGKYDSLSPSKVVWESDSVRLTLEKPLTVKYVGLGIYNDIVNDDITKEAIQEKLRKDFISEF
ncbi:MAG: hypothetical protein OCD02_08920 [Spirochaetaceae bacterium]